MLFEFKLNLLKRSAFAIFCSFHLFAVPLVAYGKNIINSRYTYYSIYPKELTDLSQEMIDRGPSGNNPGYTFALTHSNIQWSYGTYMEQNYCYLKDVLVETDITVTMPSIPRRFRVSEAVMKGFNYLYGEIDKHEQQHVRNAKDTGNQIEAYLKGEIRSSNCLKLREMAKNYGFQQLDKLRAKDKEFDRQTQRQLDRLLLTYDY